MEFNEDEIRRCNQIAIAFVVIVFLIGLIIGVRFG